MNKKMHQSSTHIFQELQELSSGCVLNLSPIVPDWALCLSERLLLCSCEQLQSEAFGPVSYFKQNFEDVHVFSFFQL